MNQTSRKAVATCVAVVLILYVVCVSMGRQHAHLPSGAPARRTSEGKAGILLLAHGGSHRWNNEVLKLAAKVNKEMPVEVAFGMANKRSFQDGIDKLLARGVREIVAVPLFISSHSSVITSTEYLLGLRKDAPQDLARFAKMDHSHTGTADTMMMDGSFDPTTPLKLGVHVRMTAALNRHDLVADILLSRARSISQKPTNEVVVIVAHGPVPDEDNAKWLGDMRVLVEHIQLASSFERIEYLTLRDDAAEEVRAKATAELRSVVNRATVEGKKVLVVPLLLSYGGIEEGLKKRLEGLNYAISNQGLLPDKRLVRWVLLEARDAAQN